MKIISKYSQFEENDVKKFIESSIPVTDCNFKLENYKDKYGWVNLYFKYNGNTLSVTQTLAIDDLTDLVRFFESIINLKEEIVVFLEDENFSEPILYVSSINDNNIRFLIADGKVIYKKWNNDKIDDDPKLSQYEIRCDVIINKQKLLKEFCTIINDLVKNHEPDEIYEIGYENWQDNLNNIVKSVEF